MHVWFRCSAVCFGVGEMYAVAQLFSAQAHSSLSEGPLYDPGKLRHVSQIARGEPVHFLPCLHERFDCSGVRQPGVSVGLRRSCARHPTLPPALPFAPAENPACCHAHLFRFLPGLIPCRSPLHGHVDEVQVRHGTSVPSCSAPPFSSIAVSLGCCPGT